MTVDVLAALVPHLAGLEGVASVHVELPHDAELRQLPCIDLQPVGPAGRFPAANGLGFDEVDVDVEVYVSQSMYLTGGAVPLAQRVRSHLATFRSGQAKAVEVSAPIRRPDRNPNIRRLGMTVTVLTPAP